MLAEHRLECRALKDAIKKALKPVRKREFVSYLTAQFAMHIRQPLQGSIAEQVGDFYQPDTRCDAPVSWVD